MANETDTLRAIGHGILTLINAAILLAILAVVLSPGGAAAGAIQAFFALLSWMVGLVVQPLGPGASVQLTSTEQPAASVPSQTQGSPTTLFQGPTVMPSTTSPASQAPTTVPMETEIPQ